MESAVSKIYEAMERLEPYHFVEFLKENKQTLLKLESYLIQEASIKAQMEILQSKNN
jgi:hypothetical protein